MDITAMHQGFKVEVDKTSALELPSFEPEEIDLWLNMYIKKFTKTRYSGINPKQQSFEETQKRTDDLRTLLRMSDIGLTSTSPSVAHPNSYFFDLPDEYWFTVGEEAEINVSGTESRVSIIQCTLDEYPKKIIDPFSEHILHYQSAKPLRIFYRDSVELVCDTDYSASHYYLTYITKPTEVSITTSTDCNLPEHTHDEIVKGAANMALENIEQPRYQTHSAEVATME